jgi:hypothetical protein
MRDLYSWNMEYNPRPEIKGDFTCKARGVSSLVMKEIRMQALNQLTATLQPEDWVYIPRRDYLAEKFKAHDLNIRLRTEEEADKLRQEQEESKMQLLTYEQLQAEISYKKAQTLGQLSKAKEHNVRATKDAATPPEQPGGTDPALLEAELGEKQAKIEDQRTKTVLALQTQDLKTADALRGMQRSEEKHQDELRRKGESHEDELRRKNEAHKTQIEIKKKSANHGMKVREKMAAKNPQPKPKQPVKRA